MRRYLSVYWAASWSWMGHLIGLTGRAFGAPPPVRRADVVEYLGNPVMGWIPATAIVFGNVINYRHLETGRNRLVRRYDDRHDTQPLVSLYDHEFQHVLQYRRWGPAFIPAYLAAELVARAIRLTGHHAVNRFERCADDACRSYPRNNNLTQTAEVWNHDNRRNICRD